MKPAFGTLFMAIWLLGINQAQADFVDGNQLHNYLKEADGTFERRFAMGYIAGIADAAQYARRRQGATAGFCMAIPAQVKAGQLADAVRIWLEKNPQARHYGGPGVVSAALEEFFPCK